MSNRPISNRMSAASATLQGLNKFVTESRYARHDPATCKGDFTFGNPHEMPPEGFVEAMQRWLSPRHVHWYAYNLSVDRARESVAETLRESHDLPFTAEHIHMTSGAFGALAVAFGALLDPGDEVIHMVPSWFHYEAMTLHAGGVPIKVPMAADFDLDLDAVASALSERTRMIIVNTPHNPAGRIFSPSTLKALADVLTDAERRTGQRIYLLSDEPYSRLVYDGAPFHSPSGYYPRTLISYSYGKVLLQPGARLGYLAMTPGLPDSEAIGAAIVDASVIGGWLYPDNLMQYATPDLQSLSIDLAALQRKRDRLVAALREIGYSVHTPEGTFYLLPECPMADDVAFTEILAEREVYVLPGALCCLPGYFRISLTATAAAIEASIPVFAEAYELARAQGVQS